MMGGENYKGMRGIGIRGRKINKNDKIVNSGIILSIKKDSNEDSVG
jgi:hypothetical protein